jgi:hypothetical protein
MTSKAKPAVDQDSSMDEGDMLAHIMGVDLDAAPKKTPPGGKPAISVPYEPTRRKSLSEIQY